MKATSLWHTVGACAIVSSLLLGTSVVCRGVEWQDTTAVVWGGRNLYAPHILPSPEADHSARSRQASWAGSRPHDSRSLDPTGQPTSWSPFGPLEIVGDNRDPSANALLRVPGEFERQEALVLAAGRLAAEHPGILASIITAAQRRVRLIGIVADLKEEHAVLQMLEDSGLPTDALALIETPHDTIWVRDYGPVFVQTLGSQRVAMDADYVRLNRTCDDDFPAFIAPFFHSVVIRLPIVFEGGNFLSNGRGICITTTRTLDQNAETESAEAEVGRAFGECFGSSQTVFLEPLSREPTGHVDMFALFAAPNVVVVGAYDPHVDPENAEILHRNAARLAGLPTIDGPLRVVRIPMPDNRDGIWRTYANAVFANGTLLVPVYPDADPATERMALDTLRHLLPAWELVSINVSEIIWAGGALHCIVANVPEAALWPNAQRDQEPKHGVSTRSRWIAPALPNSSALEKSAPSGNSTLVPEWNRVGMENAH